MERWQLKTQAKTLLRGKWNRFALYTLLLLAILGVLGLVQNVQVEITLAKNSIFQIVHNLDALPRPLALLLYVAGKVLSAFFLFGYVDIFIKTRAGVPADVRTLFQQFKVRPGQVVGVALLYEALAFGYILVNLAAAALMPLLAAPLCIACMVLHIFLVLRFSMVSIILLENPYTTVREAFVQSYYVMQGYTWRFAVLCLSFLGWIILGAFTIGIAYLWLYPYIAMTTVSFYYDIKARQLGAANADK